MMDDETSDEDTQTVNRCPGFSREEINALLNLVEKYHNYVLNKSITGAASRAKDAAWIKIAKEFNNLNLGYTRSPEKLRTKWNNLKKSTKKLNKSVLDIACNEFDINERIIAFVAASESIGSIDNPKELSEEEMDTIENESKCEKDLSNGKVWMDSDGDDLFEKSRRNRAQNFTPKECKLLLQCVRKEKTYVLCKDVTTTAIDLKNKAWIRITEEYNRMSPQKRTTKMLRTKFMSMKKLAKKVGSKMPSMREFTTNREKLVNDFHNIKVEPSYSGSDSEHFSEPDEDSFHREPREELKSGMEVPASADPLSCVLNGDSGIGSCTSNPWNWNQPENSEVVKLKLELLNYQLETAKLERKRLEEKIKEDEAERSTRETERALRLRAARLNAISASFSLPPEHPALIYPSQELPAQKYLSQTQFHHHRGAM